MTSPDSRPASVADVHAFAAAMPHVTLVEGERAGNPVYQVGGRSFVFFRTPRPDALDAHGERLEDVIVIWVPDEEDKLALVQDTRTPFFTTPHFDGHLSVLVQASRLGEISRGLLRELIQDAWLSRASATRQRAWLARHG